MIKHSLGNWIYNNELEGLLFFAQRLNESLFDFSPDKYKAPTLYTITSCVEVIRTIEEVKEGIWPLKTLETVLNEFRHLYKCDDIAQKLVNADVDYYFMKVEEPNLDNLKIRMELLFMKIQPPKYFPLLKDSLKESIKSCKQKRKIEDYTLKFVTLLSHFGYTKEYLYRKTNDFFFKENRIDSVDIIDTFFSLFDLEKKKYEVFIKISRLFKPLEETCKTFNIIRETNDEISKILKVNIDTEILIKITGLSAKDPYKAYSYANKLLHKINDLFTFYYHKQRLSWSVEAVAKELATNELFHVKKRITAMQKGTDYYPQDAAERLKLLLINMGTNFKEDSFFRINRGIDFHGTSIENKLPENQLIQNWIALETLIVNNNSDSKINLILKGLIPVLNHLHIKRLFQNLSIDIQRLRNKEIDEVVNKIPEGNTYSEKMTALCVIQDNLDIAKEFLNLCSDFPLLRFRVFQLNSVLSNANDVINYLENHRQRVEWHIRRIYRTRNLITHSGKVPTFIDSLVESSHSYLDKFINTMIILSEERQIHSIQQGIEEIQIKNRIHNDYLKKNLKMQCDSDNYKSLLWGEF